VIFFIAFVPRIKLRNCQHHFHMMGGSCTQVWKTGDLGTRRTRKCPAHSRHNLTADTKKAPAEILVALVRLDLVKGFHTLVADFAATGEGYLGGWRSARWAMATRVAGNLRHWP
jgi:hypothetical protein